MSSLHNLKAGNKIGDKSSAYLLYGSLYTVGTEPEIPVVASESWKFPYKAVTGTTRN